MQAWVHPGRSSPKDMVGSFTRALFHCAFLCSAGIVYLVAGIFHDRQRLLLRAVHTAAAAWMLLHQMSFVKLADASWHLTAVAVAYGGICGPILWSTLSSIVWKIAQAFIPAPLLPYFTQRWRRGMLAGGRAIRTAPCRRR